MSRGLSSAHMPIAVAVYLPEQYPRLLATAEDASDLEATWQEWHQVLQETKQKMAALGMHLIEVIVDLEALDQYCQEQGLKIRVARVLSMLPTYCLSSVNDKHNFNSDHH